MKPKKRYKHLFATLLVVALSCMMVPAASAQSTVNMIHGDSIVLDACSQESGVIYDDGGLTGNYSNNFDGYVLIQATEGMTITVTGNYATESCCDKLTIEDGTTTLLDEAGGTGTVNVSTTTGQLLIRFHTDGSVQESGFVLNWSVDGLSDLCTNPVSGLDTTAVTANSIGLTWTATNGAGPFTVVCGDQTVTGVTSTSYTVTGLNASTSYEIVVVASAATGNRCCADRMIVRTACGNATLPYTEGFEGMSEGSFPSCWLQVTNFDEEDYLPQVVTTQHSSGAKSLLLSCGNSESAGHFGLVATPPLEGVGSHTVRLMMRASHSGIQVQFGTCDSVGTTYNQYGFTPVQTVYVYNTGEWQEYRFTWNSTNNGNRLALRMVQEQQGGIARRLYIDDMGIENCGVDSLRTLHVEYDQLDLLWSTYGNPTCNVGVRPEGAVADVLTFNNATSPLHITGLSPETRYRFTVYPTCAGSLNIGRNTVSTTPAMPLAAAGYCSDFSGRMVLPTDWTYTVVNTYCSGHFYMNAGQLVYGDGCSGGEAFMTSPRLIGLPGRQVAVTYSGYNNGAMIILGTMVHADDPTTFVPLDTAYADGGRHTMTATVPSTSTGRHVALRFKNQGWYIDMHIHSVNCSDCAVEEAVVEHRRGTTMVISWAHPYDTVLVQYGVAGFALGTGTVDTFYNVQRGTLGGLTPSTEYDLFVYRPCQTPCEDMRYRCRTATQDYGLPYCENFATLYENAWNYNYGDWRNLYSTNGRPTFEANPFDGLVDRALTLSSWGFDYGYYSAAELPDVEVDSGTVLSFYIYDQAPQSTIVVGVVPENNEWPFEHFQVLDSIHINAYNRREHYNYTLRMSDTLMNNRLVLLYCHPYQYSYYNCYIDELQLQHPSYGTLQSTHVGFDTARFDLTSLNAADSAVVTLVGGGKTFVDTIVLAEIHNFGFGGLDTGTLYMCYVRPLSEGCNSYAGYVVTLSYGVGYGTCFPFNDVLSNELPARWAADGEMDVTGDGYLRMAPGGAVAMHPMSGLDDMSFSFKARGLVNGATLVVGSLPADSISVDSTHFGPQMAYFSPIDTVVLGTEWEYHMLRLPSTLVGEVRMVLRGGSDTVDLDEVEISACPIVHFKVDGNSIICTLDEDRLSSYYLTLDDSAGTDHRVMYVESNPFRITGLQLGSRYDLSWWCIHSETACRPTVTVRTGNTTPVPYCVDFDATTEGTMAVPPTWTFITPHVGDDVSLVSDGPSLNMNPYYNRWMYLVLPEFDVDSVLSLHAYFHSWYRESLQVGVMNNASDTSSFVPLWTSPHTGWHWADVELSGHVGKRVAIRVNRQIYLRRVHAYGYPLAKLSLVAAHRLKVTTEYEGPYWLYGHNSSQDTLFRVDTTAYWIDSTFTANVGWLNVSQSDSTGYTCEDIRSYDMSYVQGLPWCHNVGWGGFGSFSYHAYGQQGVNYIARDNDNRRAFRFYGQSSSWKVLPDLYVDSVRHAGMRVRFDAGSQFDTLVVGVMTDAYDTASFVPVEKLVYTLTDDSIQTAFVDLSSYTGDGRWVALHHLYNSNAAWFDLRYLYVDACPGALSASASLSRWNRVKIDSEKVPFYVEYGYSGQGQGSGSNTIMRVDSVPIILTLDPETRYDFYFRCDSLGSTCVAPQQVVTLAAPMELPTCVDFDTVGATLIPRNWQRRNPNIGASSAQVQSGTMGLEMPVASNSYLITPDINVDSIQEVALSLWYKVEDAADRLVVGVMSDPADMSTFYPVRTLAPAETGVWQHGMVEFSHAPSESHFIAIRARSNRQDSDRKIYIDNIFVTDCAAFDFTVQRLTNNSIDLTWSHLGDPNITITMLDGDEVRDTYSQVAPPLHIEPLDMLHYYTFRFSSTCDAADTGYCSTNYNDSLSVVTPAPGMGCVNPTDLASPQAVFFSGSYNNPYSLAGAINYGSMHPDSRHTVCYDTAQRDPRTGNQLRTIPVGYTSSVRLGNWSSNYYNPEAEGVIYSLVVDTSSFELLLLRYAAVLQDPQHAASDQPRFRMELLDTNYNIIDSACTSADFIADQMLGWHTAEDGVLWKDWTAVGVDLSAHAGEQVYFRLTTYDCNEGSHYGYAYFTLECMRKNMNTVSCGDVDSNTLSAPEGFNYRWYNSQSTATISTAQSITVPSEDITYYCDVSKLDNASCHFVISAYGGTRYPMASFDTSVVADSCRFFVTFTNTSTVSKDGITPMMGEQCETAYWDFGNGTSSSNYHGYAVYDQPGTYTVRLVSGIAFDSCQDTTVVTLDLELPPGMAPSDTTVASICDNEWYTYYSEPYNLPGTYYHHVPIPTHHCDSINVLMLDVRPTSVVDTVAVVCDSISWHGNTYTESADSLMTGVGLNSVNCDSTLRLSLTVNYSQEVNDSIYICPGYPYVYNGVDYGGPTAFDAMFYTVHRCDSLVHVTLLARDSSYRLQPLFRFDSADWQMPDSILKSCDPALLEMRDSTAGAVAWDWRVYMADTLLLSTDSTIALTVAQGQETVKGYVNLIVQDTLGCYDTVGWPLFVFRSSVPDFQWQPDLPAMHNPEVQFENTTWPSNAGTVDSISFLWRIQNAEGGSFDTTSEFAPFYHWGLPGDNMAGDYTVRLITSWPHEAESFRMDTIRWMDTTLVDATLYEAFNHTCVDSMEHLVTITNDYLQFPNLVTPNDDGVNDVWMVKNLLEYGNFSMNELWIYDRTGALVYHARNIIRPDQFWDPNATRSPDGTYFYRFMGEGEYGLVKCNGLIEVLR